MQERANTILQSQTKLEARKSYKSTSEQIAREVLDGKWGNGDERKARLEAAGYNYTEIQQLVNAILLGR